MPLYYILILTGSALIGYGVPVHYHPSVHFEMPGWIDLGCLWLGASFVSGGLHGWRRARVQSQENYFNAPLDTRYRYLNPPIMMTPSDIYSRFAQAYGRKVQPGDRDPTKFDPTERHKLYGKQNWLHGLSDSTDEFMLQPSQRLRAVARNIHLFWRPLAEKAIGDSCLDAAKGDAATLNEIADWFDGKSPVKGRDG